MLVWDNSVWLSSLHKGISNLRGLISTLLNSMDNWIHQVPSTSCRAGLHSLCLESQMFRLLGVNWDQKEAHNSPLKKKSNYYTE